MRVWSCIAVFALALGGGAIRGQESVTVGNSSVSYATKIEATVNNKKVPLKLTGAGMRKKAIINVYTIASYVQWDFAGKSAEELAAADTVKQLHIVMQRAVTGEEMAKAFVEAIRNNYPNEFAAELERLTQVMSQYNPERGDNVWITHFPGYGIHINLVGKKAEFIKGLPFAKAVWEIYLGPKNIGEPLKKALLSRLP